MPLVTVLAAACAAAVAWVAACRCQRGRRRETERRLNEADAHLRALVDHSSSAIYVKDRQRRYLVANRRHIELWPGMGNFRPGMTPSDFFPADVAGSFAESDDRVFDSGRKYTFEEDIPHVEGMRTYLSSKFPVYDTDGRIIAVGGISTDITDLKLARASIARKELVLRRLIEVQEAEKQRLCHEFHDGLIQYVVGSKMLLDSLDRSRLPPECSATLDAVIENLSRGLDDGRRVIRGIRPAALDDLGLAAALEDLCGQSWPAGPTIDAEIDPGIDDVSAALQTTVYRVVQESLSNVRRHSEAGRVTLTARKGADGIEVAITDTGRGFDMSTEGRVGFGLIGMEERVRLAGGDFRIEAAPGRGTHVAIRLPLA